MQPPVEFSVSEFVAVVNQTLDYAYPEVIIEGEVAEFRVSKGKWVYFKLKDDDSSVQMFGTVYHIVQPIEDGMLVKIRGNPRLHNKYGFSVNIQSITPSGEGDIKKSFELLKKKLQGEGLFDEDRKREIPKIPKTIGLITSAQAAAYGDFMEIINQRWSGVDIKFFDVQVQGEKSPEQIVEAINYFNQAEMPVDVLVIIRGGGSAEDLNSFSTEPVARAVAGSRTPTIVGVGHEEDVSLADMVSDKRAATPTDAATIVVPNKEEIARSIDFAVSAIIQHMQKPKELINEKVEKLIQGLENNLSLIKNSIENNQALIKSYDPSRILKRGYSLVKDKSGKVIANSSAVKKGEQIMIELGKGKIEAEVSDVK